MTAVVISVWPPTTEMPRIAQTSWSSANSRSTFAGVVAPEGKWVVTRSQRGSAPRQAMSFAFTSIR